MMIDTSKEACDILEKVVDQMEDGWDKDQAIDAVIFMRGNTFDKDEIAGEIESIDTAIKVIKAELRLDL